MKAKHTLAVVKARNREFYRDKAGLGWNLVMPLLMILGFAFLFSGGPDELFKVGIVGGQMPSNERSPFLDTRHIRFIPVGNLQIGIDKVRHHRLDMLLDLRTSPRYWINDRSPAAHMHPRCLGS